MCTTVVQYVAQTTYLCFAEVLKSQVAIRRLAPPDRVATRSSREIISSQKNTAMTTEPKRTRE